MCRLRATAFLAGRTCRRNRASAGAALPDSVGGMATHREPLARFYSVIPAGGIGSRLWPLSRADAPKFLHDLTGSGSTLLRATWDRLAPISGPDPCMRSVSAAALHGPSPTPVHRSF